MINKKHITLFTLCAFTVASLFTNVQAAEKTELSEGMYNWFLVQAYNSACSLNGGKEGLWDNEIEGKAAEEWIEDTAILYGKEYLASELKFDEEELTIEDSSLETMESTKERYWNELGYGRYYENYGVTEDEFNSVLLHELKTDLLYKQDESELLAAVTEEQTESYVKEHGALFEFVAVPYEEKEAYEDYQKRLEDGETLEDIAKEIYKDSDLQNQGFGSSYTSYSESALYFDTDTSLTTAFWDAVTEAEYNENVSFYDEASQFYILFKKVEFSMDWPGIDLYESKINSYIASETFTQTMNEWAADIELSNEDTFRESVNIKERFA